MMISVKKAALFLAAVATHLIQSPARAEPGYWCKTNTPIAGEAIVYISESGCLNVLKKAGYKILFAAPDWKPVMYSDTGKTYCPMTIKELSKQLIYLHSTNGELIHAERWQKTDETKTAFGHKIRKYVYDRARGSEVRAAEFWMVDDIFPPKQHLVNIKGFWECPVCPNLPFKEILRNPQRKYANFDTLDLKAMDIPKSTYQLPHGYKKVKSHIEVVMGSYAGDLEDMAGELGAGLGSKPAHK